MYHQVHASLSAWHSNPSLPPYIPVSFRQQGLGQRLGTFFLCLRRLFPRQSNLMFGWKLRSYKTLFDAAEIMISLQLGIFNYEEVMGWGWAWPLRSAPNLCVGKALSAHIPLHHLECNVEPGKLKASLDQSIFRQPTLGGSCIQKNIRPSGGP